MAKLGDKVKCKITGIVGIVTGETRWIYGCTRIGIQQKAKANETPKDLYWVDEPQVDVVEEKVISRAKNDTGGPMSSVPLRNKEEGR